MRRWYNGCVKALALILLAACGGAQLQTVTVVNRSSRPIQELYVYPVGAANHGTSRGSVAPNGQTEIKVKPGNIEVMALSAKLQVDEHTRDQPSASGDLEVSTQRPAQVIFYDDGSTPPPEASRPGVFGFAFVIPKAAPKPDDDSAGSGS